MNETTTTPAAEVTTLQIKDDEGEVAEFSGHGDVWFVEAFGYYVAEGEEAGDIETAVCVELDHADLIALRDWCESEIKKAHQ